MADDQDSSQKTEEPTAKKLEDARKKGQTANSREVNHWFMILAAAVGVGVLGPAAARDMMGTLTRFVAAPDTIPTGAAGFGDALARAFMDVAGALLPVFAVLLVAAIGAGIVQGGFLVAGDRITPKLEKISIVKGFGRLFSLKSMAEFIKGVIKIAVVGTVATLIVLPELEQVELLPTMPVEAALVVLHDLIVRLLIAILAIMTLVAGLDYLYQRFEHIKGLRMSRREIKDEMRQSEGDPHVKARLRQIRMERARRRMMAAVPSADVVITNPTHYAVALRYDGAAMAAPTLVAKGADAVAQRIREVAEDNDVPVVENPPVARALFAAVELDQEIPSEHYKAVAEIISYVFRLKGRMPEA